MARPLRPYPPPPELNGQRNFFFSLKIAKTDLDNFFSPNNFWTKIALFFGKYCNIQVKIPTDKNFNVICRNIGGKGEIYELKS